ncbi:MAG: DGQHR domain-containing protein [Anaerolineaceae bacterium]|nr:DGQHR domain-containing protein [Anaerolineaceae bacterium]
MVIGRIPDQNIELGVQKFVQGGRTAYSTVMRLDFLDEHLTDRFSRERIQEANRRFHPSHQKKIEDYLYETDDWVLGSILLGLDPSRVNFQSYLTESGQPTPIGSLSLPRVPGLTSARILDGQHRRMAIRSVRERMRSECTHLRLQTDSNEGKNSASSKLIALEKRLDKLDAMSVPVVIFEESNISTLQQMFADLAKTRAIDAISKARFDERDPFNYAAHRIVNEGSSMLFSGRIEMERSTPAVSSNHLLSLNQLATCLKYLQFGYPGRMSGERMRVAQHRRDSIYRLGVQWADDFLPGARKEYANLLQPQSGPDIVGRSKQRHISYTSTVLQLLAGCVYEFRQGSASLEPLQTYLNNSSFDLNDADCLFRKARLVNPESNTLQSRSQEIRYAIEYIAENAMATTR